MTDHFTGRIFQALDFIQIVMIELFYDRVGSAFDIAVVDEITLRRRHFTFDDDIESERVPVEAAAFMAVGEGRQIVGRFEMECFAESDAHRTVEINR